jgi:hypothetical protein
MFLFLINKRFPKKNIHKLAPFTRLINKQLPLIEIRNAQRKAIKKALSKKYS